MTRFSTAAAFFCLIAGAADAGSLIVAGSDGKADQGDGKYSVAPAPVSDMLTVIDAATIPLRILGEVPVRHSVSAPPHSVALSPDGRLALVAAPNRVDPKDGKRLEAESYLQLVDLAGFTALPPVPLAHQPLTVAISLDGSLAVTAQREGIVTLFAIEGNALRPVSELSLGDAKTRTGAAAFTPDGRHVLVTQRSDDVVQILDIEGGKLADHGVKVAVGHGPYDIDVSPDGAFAVIGNMDAERDDTVSVLDLRKSGYPVVARLPVHPSPEGVAISPDGRLIAVSSINGSNKARDNPLWSDHGALVIYRFDGERTAPVAETAIGHNPQGVIFTADSRYVVVQDYNERRFAVYRLEGGTLTLVQDLPIAGHPASLRAAP